MGSAAGEVSTAGVATQAAAGLINIVNGAQVGSQTSSEAKAGDVSVTAGTLLVDSSELSTGTYGSGRGGSVRVEVADTMSVLNAGEVSSGSLGAGNAGNVSITSSNLILDNGVVASATLGNGNAGSVSVRITGPLNILNQGGIFGSTFGPGNAGNLSISAGSLHLGNAAIVSDTYSTGDAGSVSVEVAGAIKALNHSLLSTSTYSELSGGAGGKISLKANSLILDDSLVVNFSFGSGRGGDIKVQISNAMTLVNNSGVTTTTGDLSSIFSSQNLVTNTGDAGNISITAGSLRLEGTSDSVRKITSDTFGSGSGGSVVVQVLGPLNLSGQSRIGADTYNGGKGGTVSVIADNLLIDGQGSSFTGISSDAVSSNFPVGRIEGGDAGSVSIRVAGTTNLINGGAISSSTSPQWGRPGRSTLVRGSY